MPMTRMVDDGTSLCVFANTLHDDFILITAYRVMSRVCGLHQVKAEGGLPYPCDITIMESIYLRARGHGCESG